MFEALRAAYAQFANAAGKLVVNRQAMSCAQALEIQVESLRHATAEEVLLHFAERGLEVFVFANNRFQGHGPATVRSLQTLIESPE